MPLQGNRWRHVIISTLNSWLPGDKRGFRARKHRLHSSGDYKNPPPENEHAGLRKYHQERVADPVVIPKELREKIGMEMVEFYQEDNHRILTPSVSGMHSHCLVELPDDLDDVKRIVGKAKRAASLKVSKDMPGRVWGARGEYKGVDVQDYQVRVYHYIWDKQTDAWVWSFKEGSRYND